MEFNSAAFIAFFAAFLTIYYLALSSRPARLRAIVVGSLVFYGAWDFRYIPLILGTAALDFAVARKIEASRNPRSRLRLVWSSVVVNLGALAYFKYANFFVATAFGLLHLLGRCVGVKLGPGTAPVFDIILPVGISFYTFQSMGYVIDVYRGELRARDSPLAFLAGVTFFPHLVAGPIIRATSLLPQFEAGGRALASEDVLAGTLLVVIGLLKKGVGDMLGVHADLFYNGTRAGGLADAWIGTLAFTGQIFADFSGYTDMALGLALLLGYVLPKNFNSPYLSESPSDFWRRWHISLSSWIRDYLFMPLALRFGSRLGGLAFAVLVTMGLCGLWHGASWTFVAFGIYHGVLLILGDRVGRWMGFLGLRSARGLKAVRRLLTFYFVHLGWVLFRAPSLSAALGVLRALHVRGGATPDDWGGRLLFVVAGLVVGHLLESASAVAAVVPRRFQKLGWAAVGALLALGLAVNGYSRPFIYFQF